MSSVNNKEITSHPTYELSVNIKNRYEDGRPKEVSLLAEAVIHGTPFPPGTTLVLRPDNVRSLKEIIPIENIFYRRFPCKAQHPIALHPTGCIKSLTAFEKIYPATGPTLPLMQSDGQHMYIPPNVKIELRSCRMFEPVGYWLSEDTLIQNCGCKKGTPVFFNEDGKLTSYTLAEEITLSEDTFIHNLLCAKNTQVSFHKLGWPKRVVIGQNHQFREGEFPAHSALYFSDSPKREIESVWLSQNTLIQGIPCAAGSFVSFYPGSSLISKAQLAEERMFTDTLLKPGTLLEFYNSPNHELSAIHLPPDALYKNWSWTKGVSLYFSQGSDLPIEARLRNAPLQIAVAN